MSLITEKYIEEEYTFSSKSKDEFYIFLAENDAQTRNCKIRSDMVTVLALRHDGSFHGDNIPMWRLMPEKPLVSEKILDIDGKRKTISVNERFYPMDIPKKVLMNKGDFNDFVRKIKESKELLFYMDLQVCYLSKRAIPTLCQRIRYEAGKKLPTMDLANEIAIRMSSMKIPMQAIIKTVNGIGKIYALMSEKYVPRKLSEIKYLEEALQAKSNLGNLQFISGVYNHNTCTVLYEFPKIEQLGTPCIEVINSDIGQSSYTVSLGWKYENDDEMVYIKRIPVSHCQNEITNDDIAEYVYLALEEQVRFLEKCRTKRVKVDESLIQDLITKVCGTVISKSYIRQIINSIKRTYNNQEIELYELLKSITVTPQVHARTLTSETQFKLRKQLEHAAEIMEEMICSA